MQGYNKTKQIFKVLLENIYHRPGKQFFSLFTYTLLKQFKMYCI